MLNKSEKSERERERVRARLQATKNRSSSPPPPPTALLKSKAGEGWKGCGLPWQAFHYELNQSKYRILGFGEAFLLLILWGIKFCTIKKLACVLITFLHFLLGYIWNLKYIDKFGFIWTICGRGKLSREITNGKMGEN